MSQDIINVREAHKFDEKKLCSYLDTHSEFQAFQKKKQVAGESQDFSIMQFNYGQSNPTYLIGYKGIKFVLRKKPPGKLLKGAHAVEREYKIQKQLFGQGFPVAEQILLCEDVSIIGTVFYIMEFMDGRIFTDVNMPEVGPDEREQAYAEMMRVLAMLHKFDHNKIGLGDYAKSGKNYYERQVKTWTMQYRAAETEKIKQMDYLIEWLPNNIPEEEQYTKTTLVHGDYKLDNVVFHKTEMKIIAVLDWELSTLGNGFSDLANVASYYHLPAFKSRGLGNFDKDMSGIPTEFMLRDSYLRNIGANFEVTEDTWSFLLAQTYHKNTSICQGVYKRSLQGNASSTTANQLLKMAKFLSFVGARVSAQNYPYRLKAEDFTFISYSEKFNEIRDKLLFFMERHVFGKQRDILREINSLEDPWKYHSKELSDLQAKARKQGLWNLFLPSVSGLTQLEYAQLCEVMGKCLLAPDVFNCNAPDTGNMETLHLYGTPEQKEKWLKPLLNCEIRSMFGMTEPAVASSDATNMACKIDKTPCGKFYRINGRKWWSSGAGDPRCKLVILMGVSKNPNKRRHEQHSMILVPMDAPGVKVLRPMTMFGYVDAPHGHMEVSFTDVLVPVDNMLLGEGRGFEIAQGRLGPGRIHHCMRLIGNAEKALELMCDRALKRRTFGKDLWDHQTVKFEVANSRLEIDQARLLVLKCADMIDKHGTKSARAEVAKIKVVCPRMACKVIDRAIQVYGGAGVSSDTVLAFLYANARCLRLADGPDEVHLQSIAYAEMLKQQQAKM